MNPDQFAYPEHTSKPAPKSALDSITMCILADEPH